MNPLKKAIKTQLTSDPGWLAGNVLDLREAGGYISAHLAGSVSIPITVTRVEDLGDHILEAELASIFLPARHDPLLLIGQENSILEYVVDWFAGRGRDRVSAVEIKSTDWSELPDEMLRSGNKKNHLWQPPEYLASHIELIPPPAAGPVLDLACGSGRAAVWLAEKGYQVTGLDREPEALAMGSKLAASRGTECTFITCDLRDPAAVPIGPWSAILNFRFLQRDLLERLVNLLMPGGVAVVRTFRETPGYQGHPHPRHRLAPGELLRYFPAAYCDVLAFEENHDDDGRPASGIIARKHFS